MLGWAKKQVEVVNMLVWALMAIDVRTGSLKLIMQAVHRVLFKEY